MPTKRENGVAQPRDTKDGRQPPEAGRGKRGLSPVGSEEAQPRGHLGLGLLAPELGDDTFL